MLLFIENIFKFVVELGILLLEIIGAGIIFVTGARALKVLISREGDSKMVMAEGIVTALSFLLGAEALKTLIAPDWRDIGMTCAILLMRAAMSLLIHWETHGFHGREKEEHSTGGAGIGE